MQSKPQRNIPWEEAFYENLRERVLSYSGRDPAPLFDLVKQRMNGIGARDYGDASFLTDHRDLIKEFSEEEADAIAYVVMEMQRNLIDPAESPNVEYHLFEAAVHAAISDGHARMAARAKRAG